MIAEAIQQLQEYQPDSDGWTLTTKPCPDPTCDRGQNTYAVRSYGGRLTGEEETRDCETCQGNEVITVEVHSACGREESDCRCGAEDAARAA